MSICDIFHLQKGIMPTMFIFVSKTCTSTQRYTSEKRYLIMPMKLNFISKNFFQHEYDDVFADAKTVVGKT